MSQQRESPFGTYLAGEALAAYRQVKLDGTVDKGVVYAGAGEKGIGVTQEAAASGARVSVKEWAGGGTFKVEAAGPVARNALLYPAASGKVDDAAIGVSLGRALESASADTAIIEVLASAPTVYPEAAHQADVAKTAVNPAAMTAAPAALTAGAPPAGGTGATEGAYDTAAHRDAAIASIAALRTDAIAQKAILDALVTDVTLARAQVVALVTDAAAIVAKINAVIAALEAAGLMAAA